MTPLRQAIQLLGLHRRTCDFCVMCDLCYQERFDNAGQAARQTFVEALAACTEDDFTNPLPVLGLITLLSESEFEDFIVRLARRAPFDASFAWGLIHLSSHGVGAWFFERGKARFQRRFHLHPAIAPLLLKSAILRGHESADLIALFEHFEPVAVDYPVLNEALPLWQSELKRRAQQRKAREEMEKAEQLRQEIERAERLAQFTSIENGGPHAIIDAFGNSPALSPWDFPKNWGQISDKDLASVPPALLERALSKISAQAPTSGWKGLSHRIRNTLKSLKRSTEIAELNSFPIIERLQVACDSRWSLTYFPEAWADEVLRHMGAIPVELRALVQSKLKRLHRRSRWRDVRQRLE